MGLEASSVLRYLVLTALAAISLAAPSGVATPANLSISCAFALGSPAALYDLSAWRGIVLQGIVADTGANISTSLCGDLPMPCVDALTGVHINGSTMLYFYEQGHPARAPPKEHCWDTVAMWESNPPNASALEGPGLLLSFSRPGDAHLDCDYVNVDVSIACAAGAPVLGAIVSAEQDNCDWLVSVETSADAVCRPPPAPLAESQGPGGQGTRGKGREE